MPGRVRLAILCAVGLHGVLILGGQYRLGFDAYNHMFFADHYLQNWWQLWEPRWYTGFWVNAYPPLVHQVNALLGWLVGIDLGYGLLLWGVVSLYPFAAYRFSRIFIGERGAVHAAFGAAFLPSIYLAGHTFGQLPTLTAGLLALLAASVLSEFLLKGDLSAGLLVAGLLACVMAAHHATLLFLPGLLGPVCLQILRTKHSRARQIALRLGLVSAGSALAMLAVIWPFWDWGRSQTIQTPIDHLSRHNFFADPFAFVMFFLPMYGLFILMAPGALLLGRYRRLQGLTLAFLAYFVFGLGGTTPLPRLILGQGWAWLTYDRFAFWASLLLLPLVSAWSAVILKKKKLARLRRLLRPAVIGPGMAGVAILVGFIPTWLPTQPRQLDMEPIVTFLAAENRSAYRYLTFGFGDQMAYLSRLTKAATLDGSYHTARTLPELRNSGLAQIDIAYWTAGGMTALGPVLDLAGERGVRWGFVNLQAYDPVLEAKGWQKISTLSNGVAVWENPAAILPGPTPPTPEDPWKEFSWGMFPLAALALTSGLALKRGQPDRSQFIFELLQAAAAGLLPFGLTLWYFRTLFANPQPRIYFTYSDALFYLSDGLAAAVVALGLLQLKAASLRRVVFWQPGYRLWLFGLCGLASASILWSLDWRTALYVSLHLWLCWALFVALASRRQAWVWFGMGSCAALGVQIFLGVWQALQQTTAMTLALGTNWPGSILPTQSGASVAALENGVRWLRAYGSLPHPNLLGGFSVAQLCCTAALFLLARKPGSRRLAGLAWVLTLGGLLLVVLTFSRSAWLGLGVVVLGVSLSWKKFERKRILYLLLPAVCLLAAVGALFFPLLYTRVAGGGPQARVETEQVSNYTRLWLTEQALTLIQKNPLLGSGAGSFSLALSQNVARFYDIEPVHNIFLLAASELGPGGIIILGLLAATAGWSVWKAPNPQTAIFSSLALGLLAIGFFDHYLWTLAPGRMMFFAVFGIAAGQAQARESE